MASQTGALPPFLQKILGKMGVELQLKVTELHTRSPFQEEDLDAFLINEGNLTLDNLKAFGQFLQQQEQKKRPVEQKKRRSGVQLPKGLGAALVGMGAAPAAAVREPAAAATPAKRSREGTDAGADAASGTPDPPARPLAVNLKASLQFAGNVSKPAVRSGPAGARPAEVTLLGDSRLWTGPRGRGAYRWADESLEEQAAARDARLTALEPLFAAAMGAGEEEGQLALGCIGMVSQAEVALVGRVLCEGLEGRLNERSILLEGSRASANGARVRLNPAECEQLAVFPGQVVGVVGRSGMSGGTFHARKLLPGLAPAEPPVVPKPEAAVHLLAMAGPFCLRDGQDYSPLERALSYAQEQRPQVLVLMGPFLDSNNLQVQEGAPVLPGEQEPCTFEEVYRRKLLPLLARQLAPLRRSSPATEVLLLPSLEEAMCFHPMPQPGLDASLGPQLASALGPLKDLGVKFPPNPCHLSVNGLRVSLTSADALSPLLRDFVLRPEGKKIEEALRGMLRQRTLLPSVPREPAMVSEARAAALDFPEGLAPDVCVFPSASGTPTGLMVDETLVLNPGPVCRPAALGTFAELLVAPGQGPLAGRARVDIQKLEAAQ